jgi:hypothetical protein
MAGVPRGPPHGWPIRDAEDEEFLKGQHGAVPQKIPVPGIGGNSNVALTFVAVPRRWRRPCSTPLWSL